MSLFFNIFILLINIKYIFNQLNNEINPSINNDSNENTSLGFLKDGIFDSYKNIINTFLKECYRLKYMKEKKEGDKEWKEVEKDMIEKYKKNAERNIKVINLIIEKYKNIKLINTKEAEKKDRVVFNPPKVKKDEKNIHLNEKKIEMDIPLLNMEKTVSPPPKKASFGKCLVYFLLIIHFVYLLLRTCGRIGRDNPARIYVLILLSFVIYIYFLY